MQPESPAEPKALSTLILDPEVVRKVEQLRLQLEDAAEALRDAGIDASKKLKEWGIKGQVKPLHALWAIARVDLGLTDEEFWRLSFYELQLLVDRYRGVDGLLPKLSDGSRRGAADRFAFELEFSPYGPRGAVLYNSSSSADSDQKARVPGGALGLLSPESWAIIESAKARAEATLFDALYQHWESAGLCDLQALKDHGPQELTAAATEPMQARANAFDDAGPKAALDAETQGRAKTDTKRRVDAFLDKARMTAGCRITRKMFRCVLGYKDDTALQAFQREDPNPKKNTTAAKRAFERLLASDPRSFVEDLQKKKLLP